MPLSVGDKVGPYEILAPIGAGGMGEVYRAHDSRLNRDVAIKVSNSQFTERFTREARTIASLNHSNICHLYDVGPDYLVMEYVEGQDLHGPLDFDDALPIIQQLIDGIEAAHEKNIIHRDLKPANIKITPEGVVKILDFGLAKATEPPASNDGNPENSPTFTMGATVAGSILGTAAYMAPEQAKGKTADRRSDIWSFGVILHEMLTGKRLFQGESAVEILGGVLNKEPDISAAPQRVHKLLRWCLEKDRKQRLASISDARRLLNRDDDGADPAVQITPASRAAWMAAATMALVAVGFAFAYFRGTPPGDPVLHLAVPQPANATAGHLALSPDGRHLVMVLPAAGKMQLWLRSFDSPQLQLLPRTENARDPFWSSDSKSIGFFADGKLKTMQATGGPPQLLCVGIGPGNGGTWNRGGVILFGTRGVGAPLQRVNASGGACTVVTKPEGGSSHSNPEFLPDGKHFVYVVAAGDEARRGLYVSSLDAGLDNPAPRRLLADQSSALFVPSTTGKKYGYLLFLRGNTLMAQPFAAETLQLVGDAFAVALEASFGYSPFKMAAAASAGGILVYATNLRGTGSQLTWLDRFGKELGKVGKKTQDGQTVALSPDGKILATMRRDQGIWLYDVQRGGETRFTTSTLTGIAPVWSPEGNLIAFGSGKGLYLESANGGLKEELLLENENLKTPSDWSRDGKYLIYTETDPKGQGDIWFIPEPLNKFSNHRPVKFQGTDAIESQGQLSPDGRWLAYVSEEPGGSEVYVRPFPSGPGRWKITVGRGLGREPRWRRDGKELFFLEREAPSNRLMAVSVQSRPSGDFLAGAPQALFDFRNGGSAPTNNIFLYGPSADGQRFLVDVQAGAESTLNVISKWEKAALGSR